MATFLCLPLLSSAADAASSPITEFNHGITSGSLLEAITAGPDGNLWFVELNGGIGKITTAGAITQYSLPGVDGNGVNAIAAGPDGDIWFTSHNGVGKITPTGSSYTEYNTDSRPRSIVAGPDGRIWFTNDIEQSAFDGSLGAITADGSVSRYPIGFAGSPYGIAVGPDGNIWFTTGQAVGKMTTTGSVTEYTGFSGNLSGITAGPDGNMWVAEESGDYIAKVTTSGAVTEYKVGPTDGTDGPFGIVAGPDGNLWFTAGYTADNISGDRVGKITTAGVVTNYTLGISSAPIGIAAGRDGNIWFAEYSAGKIGRLNLNATGPTPSPAKRPPRKAPQPKHASYAGTWRARLSGTITTTDANGSTTTSACCSRVGVFTVSSKAVGDPAGAPPKGTEQFVVWSPGPPNASGNATLSSTIVGYNNHLDPPLPCTFLARFSSAGAAQSVGAISCQYDGHQFSGSFRAWRIAP